jgi:hypothetical protein
VDFHAELISPELDKPDIRQKQWTEFVDLLGATGYATTNFSNPIGSQVEAE